MDKYIILLPMNYNDGSAVPKAVLRRMTDDLYQLAGGYTLEGNVKGAYKMKDGRRQDDVLMKVSVLVPPEKSPDLKALVRSFCVKLDQEAIWLEKSLSLVEFVGPAPLEDKS